MMMRAVAGSQQHTINLQATLSASSANNGLTVNPHHPITCTSALQFEEDGTFACEHVAVPSDDRRTKHCIDHSIAMLLIELAVLR